jgi:N-acetylglucosaminyl-diphospho-decaprenol L-rhamnosyltransferase
MKDLSIIIVHYNQPDHLERCLDSIHRSTLPASTELLVVDNGSKDLDCVRRLCSHGGLGTELVASPVNLGLARAANLAARRASGRYILNLNPDVIVHNDAIALLKRHLDENSNTGIVFPRLLNPDGSLQLSCRTHYDLLTVLLRRTPLSKFYRGMRIRNHLMADWDHGEVKDIDWAVGAAFMIRREAISNGCLFDGRYFLYMEDVDLCLTLKSQGWRIHYVPSAVMTHHHIRSSGRHPFSRANWEHFKSFIRFGIKHGGFNGKKKSPGEVKPPLIPGGGGEPC